MESVLPVYKSSRSRQRRKRTTDPVDLLNQSNERSSRTHRRISATISPRLIFGIGRLLEIIAKYFPKLVPALVLVCLRMASLRSLHRDRPCIPLSSRPLHLYECMELDNEKSGRRTHFEFDMKVERTANVFRRSSRKLNELRFVRI